MNLDGIFNIAGAIVTLAVVTVVVTSLNTSKVIRSVGRTFSDSIRAASGR